MSFKDHFSAHATLYAQFRPRYPEALFQYLASISPDRERAWDCATGNGQAAAGLRRYFRSVIATDASPQQVANAEQFEGVEYRVGRAEESGIETSSVALVTVAQALHWFDIPAFFAEAARVLKPNGIVAAWTYALMSVAPDIDSVVERYYRETTAEFWPPERAMVDAGYATLAFPFEEVSIPQFDIQEHWSREQVLGYLRSWSASQKLIAARGDAALNSLAAELSACWPDGEMTRLVRWPLRIRVGRSRWEGAC